MPVFQNFSFLNGRVRLLVLLGLFNVRTAVHVFGARVYRILLASLRHFLVDDTRVLVILFVLVVGRNVRLASGADAIRSLLIAATSRCNKQRHDRSRQMCVCGFSFSLSLSSCTIIRLFLFLYFLRGFSVREFAVRYICLMTLPFILSTNRYYRVSFCLRTIFLASLARASYVLNHKRVLCVIIL